MTTQLNILILTLSYGEEIIANVKKHIEMVDDKPVEVCYNLVYPFKMREQSVDENGRKTVMFSPWKEYSSDTQFLIGYDDIINICAPLPNVLNSYKDAVNFFIETLNERAKNNDL
jgi:hypothetical protein